MDKAWIVYEECMKTPIPHLHILNPNIPKSQNQQYLNILIPVSVVSSFVIRIIRHSNHATFLQIPNLRSHHPPTPERSAIQSGSNELFYCNYYANVQFQYLF
jgi:hypothetical protein